MHVRYVRLSAKSRPRDACSESPLRRTTVLLRRTTTILSCVLNRSFNLSGGACHGGNHGHASLCLPGNGGGSLHGHRNGACDAPAIGVVKSLLSTLPPAAPNGWHSVLASRSGTAREYALRGCESSLGARSLNGLENGLKEGPSGPYFCWRVCLSSFLGWSACAGARQPFVRAPLPTACKHQIEENEAEQYGELTAVNRWKKTLRRMGHEVSNGHVTSEDKGGRTRE